MAQGDNFYMMYVETYPIEGPISRHDGQSTLTKAEFIDGCMLRYPNLIAGGPSAAGNFTFVKLTAKQRDDVFTQGQLGNARLFDGSFVTWASVKAAVEPTNPNAYYAQEGT